MVGRRSADDAIDARIRFSEDILRDAASSATTRDSSQASAPRPADQTSSQHAHPSLRLNTDLYTIPSHIEGPSQPPSHGPTTTTTVVAGKGPGKGGAFVTVTSPVDDGEASMPAARQTRRSGVSFVDAPRFSITRARLGLTSIDGFHTVTKPPSRATAAATRVSENTRDALAKYRDWLNRQRERQRRWTTGPFRYYKKKTAVAYRTYILEGLLRQRPLPPSADGRHVPLDPGRARTSPLIDERTGKPYVSNFIRSSRYTVWDFVPRQLIFQFMKLANFYFLIISILQMIPGLSTTGTYTTIAPLMFFVAISMFKEGFDDYRRYRLDRVENRSTAWVLDPGHTVKAMELEARDTSIWHKARHPRSRRRTPPASSDGPADGQRPSAIDTRPSDVVGITELIHVRSPSDDLNESTLNGDDAEPPAPRMPWAAITWQDLRVGDIVRLRRDDPVPADMIVLRASGPNGIAYIETMALDGETNLKTKQACSLLADNCESLAGMAACGAELVSEDPNLDLYNYEGRAIVNGEAMPLTLNQVVYRGSVLRNTTEMIGIVINTGEECKIRMNAHRYKRAKAPAMQAIVNRIVILLVIFVILLAVGSYIGNRSWESSYAKHAWYLDDVNLPISQILVAFIIMFNTLIPLSLYVSLEIIKLGQLYLLADTEVYDPDTDTPMVANTTTILENLGQVDYIFSDKTGTLTENKMRFRKMSVAGTAWLHDMDIARDEEEKERWRQQFRHKGQKSKKRSLSRRRQSKSMARPSADNFKDDPTSPTDPSPSASHMNLPIPMTNLPPASPMSPVAPSTHNDAPTNPRNSTAFDLDPPRRSMSTQWRSTARPTRAQSELKTEDLIQYIRHRPHTAFSRKARHFIMCIALCHTCLPEKTPSGEIEFQAASPDELALVQAARDLGYLLVDRPAQSIKLQFQQLDGTPVTETYQVLDVIEFSSQRKRMSIVIRMPDGRICMFCKGADSVILPRLKLHQMALAKASAVERRASKRKSVEQERAMMRRSTTLSIAGGVSTPRSSMNIVRAASMHQFRALPRMSMGKTSVDNAAHRRSSAVSGDVDGWLRRREREDLDLVDDVDTNRRSIVGSPTGGNGENSKRLSGLGGGQPRQQSYDGGAAAVTAAAVAESLYDDPYSGMVDESVAINEGAIFERCFQHIDDFASEGLRTLLFAYRYVEDDDYRKWKAIFHDATTSLVNRQERIEAAAELLEQGFDLAGATAIEDKLQQGVPETVDKMRRANIKIWMLTGDKRETAINIANAARICKPFSEIYVLDALVDGDSLQERISSTLVDVGRGMTPHSVVVIDGHTLSIVEGQDEMRVLFFDLVSRVDSVICCRASPSQKATLVKCIRQLVPSSMTLAIGDGANDIAMIQASHVGIGISGREGLQAARISDYSIAQFRFLQRLLLVHGRWNYVRTGKYILATFWKELVFYLTQALYQRYNGYTGTSLYESTSLTVFNTLFTSLTVIFLGMFEKDMRAETLLAVPELYTYGQRNQGFCFRKYVGWMAMAVTEALIIFYTIYAAYIRALFITDTTLYALGSLSFSACVTFINIKIFLIEMHTQTIITAIGFIVSVGGWFMWSILLSLVFAPSIGPYSVHHTFLDNFGRSAVWWLTLIGTLMAVVVLELIVNTVRRAFFATDVDIMQQIEHDRDVRAVFREHAAEAGEAGEMGEAGEAGALGGEGAEGTGALDAMTSEAYGRHSLGASADAAGGRRVSHAASEEPPRPARASYSVSGARNSMGGGRTSFQTATAASANTGGGASATLSPYSPVAMRTMGRRSGDVFVPPPLSPALVEEENVLTDADGSTKGKNTDAKPKLPSVGVTAVQPSSSAISSGRRPQVPALDTSSKRWIGDLVSPASPSSAASPSRVGITASPIEMRSPKSHPNLRSTGE